VRATENDIHINGITRNGSLEALSGNITIKNGQVTNETIYAPEGIVEIFGNVEAGTSIYAKKVIIHGAVFHSLIVADEVDIHTAISCQVLGKKITIGSLNVKHGIENIIFVEAPNRLQRLKKIATLTESIKAIHTAIGVLRTESDTLKLQTPIPIEKIAAFLNSLAQNKEKSAAMNDNDKRQFRAIMPYMEIVKKYVNCIKEIVQKETEIFKYEEDIHLIGGSILEDESKVSVKIPYIAGDTRVLQLQFEKSRNETLDYPKSLGILRSISGLNLKIGKNQLIFDGTSGTVDWKIPPTE